MHSSTIYERCLCLQRTSPYVIYHIDPAAEEIRKNFRMDSVLFVTLPRIDLLLEWDTMGVIGIKWVMF